VGVIGRGKQYIINKGVRSRRLPGHEMPHRHSEDEQSLRQHVLPDSCRRRRPLALLLPRFALSDSSSLRLTLPPGSIRTATKRAGGTVRNHGGSPGKRLGIKKFSGAYCVIVFPVYHSLILVSRPTGYSWKHYCSTTRYLVPPWPTCTCFTLLNYYLFF
jgi:hypothetical protein